MIAQHRAEQQQEQEQQQQEQEQQEQQQQHHLIVKSCAFIKLRGVTAQYLYRTGLQFYFGRNGRWPTHTYVTNTQYLEVGLLLVPASMEMRE